MPEDVVCIEGVNGPVSGDERHHLLTQGLIAAARLIQLSLKRIGVFKSGKENLEILRLLGFVARV